MFHAYFSIWDVQVTVWGEFESWNQKKPCRRTHAFCSGDKAMHQLGALSLLLRFDKYNFKRSSQTALAGRLHNEHNNSPPPGSSSLVHLPLQSAAMPVCARVFVSLQTCRRLPTFCSEQSGCIEEPFGPNFLQRKCIPPPSAPFYLPLTCNAWLTTAPLKEVKGQPKQSGVMATCVPPTRIVRRGAGGAKWAVS